MKKTILHFSQDFNAGKTQLGGYSRIYNICSDENQHMIFCISPKNHGYEESWIDNIHVIAIALGSTKFNKFQQLLLINKTAQKIVEYLSINNIDPDILFGHSHLFNGFVLKRIQKKLKTNRKFFWEVNVMWGIHKVRGPKGLVSNLLNRYLQKKIFCTADYIIAQTEASRLFINSFYKIPYLKIAVIQNAINTSIISSSRYMKSKSFQNSNIFPILFCGLFDSMNGAPFLIEFIRKHQIEGFRFTFIGEGLFKSQIEELANDGKCCYMGSFSYKKMQEEFANYDFLIIPRLAQVEADLFIPTKLIEGMYHGLIPICSKVKSMEQVINHNVNGFVFEPEDSGALFSLLKEIKILSEDNLKSISNEASNTILRDFTWEKNYERLNYLYNVCL